MRKKIVAVTGCPTGIAHTFMAEKALLMAAQEVGCDIKVETNGAIGVENQLSVKDIEEADAVIVACDKNVDMERFNGKAVMDVPVADGMKKAKELIQKCLDGKVPIQEGVRKIKKDAYERPSLLRQLYKHIMNGVSHMLPLVVAGGVLIAISFLWGIYSFDPKSAQYNEIAALIKTIGGYSMNLMTPVLAAFIAQSISNKPGMLAGLVGGMIAHDTGSGFLGGIIAGFFAGYFTLCIIHALRKMPRQLEGLKSIFIVPIITTLVVGVVLMLLKDPVSWLNTTMMQFLASLQNTNPLLLGTVVGCMSAFDMGGPVNKAAYLTGTALLSEGNFYFMAGVSAACMAPPLVIALAATFKKDRFTPEDRSAGYINYVLGCTHITEGAIPFAAKNPLKVIPVLMIASSIAAILTYYFKIQVPAPHGGFLIIGLVNQALLWILCIFAGSAIGAVLYVCVTPKVVYQRETIEENYELYNENTVVLHVKGTTKEAVIEEMVDVLVSGGIVQDKAGFQKDIYMRETASTTGIGGGIAIPHARSVYVNFPRVAVGLSKSGFDFDALDHNPCYLIFMIAVSDKDGDLHLHTLSELSKKLMEDQFVHTVRGCTSKEEVVQLLRGVS